MCGIIGCVGNTSDSFKMMKKNESRGGHAWGIAWDSPFQVYKVPGVLPQEQPKWWPNTQIMIGHTRFATHGNAEENENNHPHFSRNFCIIHNGVIQNVHPTQKTKCDSEAILKMIIERNPKTREETIKAIRKIAKKIEGSWRIALLNNHTPNTIYVFNDTDPVYWGIGTDKIVFASEEKDLPKGVVKFKGVCNALYIVELVAGQIRYDFTKLSIPERITYLQDWKSYQKPTYKINKINKICTDCRLPISACDSCPNTHSDKAGENCWGCSHVLQDNGSCITCDRDTDCDRCNAECQDCNKWKAEMRTSTRWQTDLS